MLGERSYSAQETAHLLLGVPLVHETFSYQTLSLGKDGALRQLLPDTTNNRPDDDTATTHTEDSWMQRYMSRPPNMEDLSIQQVFQRYKWYRKAWKPRKPTSTVIVLTYPRLSPNPADDRYDEYCRLKIILPHPFRKLDDFHAGVNRDKTWQELYALCCSDPAHSHPSDTLRDWGIENRRHADEDE